MTNVIISVPDEQVEKLHEIAAAQGLTLEEMAYAKLLATLDDGAAQGADREATPEEFSRAATYVLEKNAELYRRLA